MPLHNNVFITVLVFTEISSQSRNFNKWTMPVRDWGLAYAQFMIYFEDRFAA